MLKLVCLLLLVFVLASCTVSRTTISARAQDIPAFTPHRRILFQGDSITDGNRGRTADPNHILGHGYVFVIAAKYGSTYPERELTFMNRGVSGNKVSDLAKRWQKDTLDLKPDILSILIGVNDLNGNVSADDFEKSYDELLAQTVKELPAVRLVLMEPFAEPVGRMKDNWDAKHAELLKEQAAVARLAAKYHAVLVNLQAVFDEAGTRAPMDYWIWDGIHPTYSGHQLVADAWAKAVGAMPATPLAF